MKNHKRVLTADLQIKRPSVSLLFVILSGILPLSAFASSGTISSAKISASPTVQNDKKLKVGREPSTETECNLTKMLASNVQLYKDYKSRIWISTNEHVERFFIAQAMTPVGAIVPGAINRSQVVNLGPCPSAQFHRTYKIKDYSWLSENVCNDEWAGYLHGIPSKPAEKDSSQENNEYHIRGQELEVCTDGLKISDCVSIGDSRLPSCFDKLFSGAGDQ